MECLRRVPEDGYLLHVAMALPCDAGDLSFYLCEEIYVQAGVVSLKQYRFLDEDPADSTTSWTIGKNKHDKEKAIDMALQYLCWIEEAFKPTDW